MGGEEGEAEDEGNWDAALRGLCLWVWAFPAHPPSNSDSWFADTAQRSRGQINFQQK